jgi:nicotinamidase/pyrazinamidase
VGVDVRFNPTSALVVVDVQNDFADPEGSLSVAGADAVVQATNAAVAEAVAAGAMVVATQDWHPSSTPHFAKDGGIWPVHCVGGTWGAEIHPSVALPGDAPRVRKGEHGEDGYSGFTMRDPVTGQETSTGLEARLRERGVERVVVCGLATDYCVMATALDALRLGFAVGVLERAVAAVNLQPGDGSAALQELSEAGVALG